MGDVTAVVLVALVFATLLMTFNLKGMIMATKQEQLDALGVLGTKIDDWIAADAAKDAAEIQKLLDAQKAELTEADATMDAADFDEIAAAIMAVANKVPAKFDPSAPPV